MPTIIVAAQRQTMGPITEIFVDDLSERGRKLMKMRMFYVHKKMTLHFRRRVATVSSIIVATQRHNMGPHRVTIFVCSFTVRDTSRRTETRTVVTQSQMLRIFRMAHFLAERNVATKRCSKIAIFSSARRNFRAHSNSGGGDYIWPLPVSPVPRAGK